ncbi:MAG TPA: EamA family transporter [Xanthobacteraceae bacterium]|nr:EamA family transporter [Xanthobacteraceae bacterium]
MTSHHLLFLLMSLIWGVTWIATKAGLSAVPPLFLAAVRYTLVAGVLASVVGNLGRTFGGGRARRVVVTGALVNVATYGLLYWGMLFVPSGVAGVVNMAMNPVFLFAFAILLGEERASWRYALALALGIAGVLVLFSNGASFSGSALQIGGAAAVVGAAAVYSLGAVLNRPLLREVKPLDLTTAQAVVGAVGLAALSLLLEPVSWQTFVALLAPAPLAGLLFVVIAGTFIAYTIFLQLTRDWGAPRAGLYSFVSPVVTLLLGFLVYGEPLTWREIVGGAMTLVAAAIAIAPRPPALPPDA